MSQASLHIVILAAGKGTRMKSSVPKVLHTLAGKAFICHVLDTVSSFNAKKISVVVGHGAEQLKSSLSPVYPDLHYVEQTEQLGTGHAVQQAAPDIDDQDTVVILYGDVPLVRAETIKALLQGVDQDHLSLLTICLDDPTGYGRILRDRNGQVSGIVEQKDATEQQLGIHEVNTGLLAIHGARLKAYLRGLRNNNKQGEYYLTDVIAMAVADKMVVGTVNASSEIEVAGVNDRQQQAALERAYQQRVATQLMQEGVCLTDPSRFDCRGTVTAGLDCTIDINCIFEGEVKLGDNVQIGAHCHLRNVTIGNNTVIKPYSSLEQSVVGQACEIGPFARLRPGTQLADNAKIGNFVEVKNAQVGEHSKVNHLSYIGDTDLGAEVNIGAGTITCNYDGVNKHRTTIGDKVFVGSNSALIAPVSLGEGSTIGAGSVITQNVEANKLALSRAPQRTISGWQRPVKNKK